MDEATATLEAPVQSQAEDALQLEAPQLDLLVEDVSIDGMCGVY